MTLRALTSLLKEIDQLHLLSGVETLSSSEREAFLLQLQMYAPFLKEQKNLQASLTPPLSNITPCERFEYKGNLEDRPSGEACLKNGRVGCLILAGGQGTRLGFDGPKGMVPVTPIKGKSLFQLLAERAKAASEWAGVALPLCIMTSELNHERTVGFFEQHKHFGLNPSSLSFFKQQQLPLIDAQGHWLLQAPGVLATGPDGNGHALQLFFKSGLWKSWKDKGVEYLNLIFVDNALADPFDPEFIGFTVRSNVDVALKAVERLAPHEPMGVVVQSEGSMRVIEYSELPSNLESFTLSSTGMFCIRMAFIEALCSDPVKEFPLHLAQKSAQIWDPELPFPHLEKRKVGKCERFIFDLLSFTSSSAAFVCPRERIYAPLKNASGEKSLETVKKALLYHDRVLHRALTGIDSQSLEIELDPVFYSSP